MTADAADMFTRVRNMIAREFGVKPESIQPHSRIREDLGICGDDGLDLFDTLHHEFNVDVSSYRHELHFEPEGLSVRSILTKSWWHFQTQAPVTVAELVEAAQYGKWKEKTPNQTIDPTGWNAP